MSPIHILKAFQHGADGVLVSGCHPGDCHYVQGNLVARRRFGVFRSLLDFVGLDPRRLHFSWVSASEGHKWVKVVEQVTDAVREAGPFDGWEPSPQDLPVDALPAPDEISRPIPSDQQLESLEAGLRGQVAQLLDDGAVEAVIGYRRGSLPGRVVPSVMTNPADAGALVWSGQCHSNLAVYLPRALAEHGKIAVVAKQCDAKAVIGLLQEGQVERERVVVVGAPCPGVWRSESLAEKCHACTGEVSDLCDLTVG
jgi:hypothetical protein